VLAVRLGDDELAKRRAAWKPRESGTGSGAIWKYAQTVGSAKDGAITHPGAEGEKQTYADI
jgi:dihydroxy-acid dehydratase